MLERYSLTYYTYASVNSHFLIIWSIASLAISNSRKKLWIRSGQGTCSVSQRLNMSVNKRPGTAAQQGFYVGWETGEPCPWRCLSWGSDSGFPAEALVRCFFPRTLLLIQTPFLSSTLPAFRAMLSIWPLCTQPLQTSSGLLLQLHFWRSLLNPVLLIWFCFNNDFQLLLLHYQLHYPSPHTC